MTLSDHSLDSLGQFDAQQLVKRAAAKGLIQGPAPAPAQREKLDPGSIAAMVERAKAAGLIRAAGETLDIPRYGSIDYSGVQMVWMDITPDTATAWLTKNVRNRPVSRDVVDAYARDMRAGHWTATHQGIAFNCLDELIDGQHRLHAICLAGITVTMLVTYGLPDGALANGMTVMDTVDRGRTRSVSDQLKIQHGMKDSAIIAAVCASLGTLCNNERTRKLSVGQTLEIYEAFKDAILAVVAKRSKQHGMKAAGVLAAFAFAGTANAKALTHYALMTTGNLRTGTPLHQLQTWLMSDAAILLNRSTDRGLMEMVLGAIEAHLQPQTGTAYTLARDEQSVPLWRSRQPERVAKIAALFALPVS